MPKRTDIVERFQVVSYDSSYTNLYKTYEEAENAIKQFILQAIDAGYLEEGQLGPIYSIRKVFTTDTYFTEDK
jgi:hypothetical protein